MFIFFDILNNLQGFSPFLDARVATTEEENFWCSVNYEDIIVVQGWPRKRHLKIFWPRKILEHTPRQTYEYIAKS